MAQKDTFRRYLDAGMAFTQMSREKAEEFVKDLVKAGEVRRKETEEVIEALLERSRRNTEDLMGVIRTEIADQLRGLGLEDMARRAGLSPKATEAAGNLDDAGASAADAVDATPAKRKKTAAKKAPAPKKAPAAKKAPGAKKTPAAKKAPAAGKAPGAGKTPAAGKAAAAPAVVVPGAPENAPAKKLIVPPSAGAPAPKKSGPAKKS